MFAQRIDVLRSACALVERNNKQFIEYNNALNQATVKLTRIAALTESLKKLDALVAKTESEWRDNVLRYLEDSISEDLSVVFPEDGYQISLSASVSRGKIHIETSVTSCVSDAISGPIRDTQGCLFQEIVSFSALVSIVKLLGIHTVYVDEAFSGASPENFIKLNKMLQRVKESGVNLVLISQSDYFEGLGGNYLFVGRNLSNQTQIKQVKQDD